MKLRLAFGILLFISLHLEYAFAQDRNITLLDSWKFSRTDDSKAKNTDFNDKNWSKVTVPHDWAIAGPFDETIDQQIVMVKEDGEMKPSKRSGRTGSLPHVGVGWYRKNILIPTELKNKRVFIEFDGAMSYSEVFLNGKKIGAWPYGYTSFMFELTDNILFGKENIVAVRLNNPEESSRWYPGAGLYRNVRLLVTAPVRVAHWGTQISSTVVNINKAIVTIKTKMDVGKLSPNIKLVTTIIDRNKKIVVSNTQSGKSLAYNQSLTVANPKLWDVNSPNLYTCVSKVYVGDKLTDTYQTRFGIRTIAFSADSGFALNGKRVKIQGVCNHHDLGPLGAAINYRALQRQLELLKKMGCNAVRTSHNPPDPQLLDLCDEMGFLVMNEAFDEWKIAKCKNGYNKLFNDWAEKDLVALIERDRNHPSVILWSIGNEIPEQRDKVNGAKVARFLTDIAHREDPTRLVTIGSNNIEEAINNGFGKVVDVFGLNYHWPLYEKLHKLYPDLKIIGSETESTVSSRGVYKFPAIPRSMYKYSDKQVSSYVLDAVRWGNTPDEEFIVQDKNKFIAGCFVWTGFDYLGEPTPYTDDYPSHSSYFGILDLGGIPKDVYYLFQSNWALEKMVHLLPHWTWPGKEGDTIPVHCFTSYNKAELFVNGKSYGIKEKNPAVLYGSRRLIWDNVIYQPGELKVVAYDENNKPVLQDRQITAGDATAVQLLPDRKTIKADGKDLSFITVSVVDGKGILCPNATNKFVFSLEGKGEILGVANGDATNIQPLNGKEMNAFGGKCVVVVKAGKQHGTLKLRATTAGLKENVTTIITN